MDPIPPRDSSADRRPFRFPGSPAFLRSLAVLLALTHAILALTASRDKSLTADEIAYLTAGQAYNTRHDYRLHPENGNLPQRWAALPLTLAKAPLPSIDEPSWARSDVWRQGHRFFYEQGLSADEYIFLGRAMIALFSAALGLLIFHCARRLFDERGAFLALALYAFSPSFLAHGALATSDVVMAFFFLAATWAWHRHLENPGVRPATLSALVLGLACVAKFSAILLIPVFAIVGIAWLARQRSPAERTRRLRRLFATTAVHIVSAWLIIWVFYGFRYSAFSPQAGPLGDFYRGGWTWILSDLGWPGTVIDGLRHWHLLPEAFLYGFTFVLQFARERAAFLNGEYSTTGWIGFFPYAFLVKSTVPFLILLVLGTSRFAIRLVHAAKDAGWRPALARLHALVPLAALLAVYGLTSLSSHLNIGHRHLLPIYPLLFVALGSLGSWLDLRRPWAALTVAALLGWHVLVSFAIRPDYLSYFNGFAGGPSQGYRHLVDSSLDWGQDLPGLKQWLEREAKGEVAYLSYFGAGEPDYEGIRARRLPFLNGFGIPSPWLALEPGVYCLSATMLQQVYSSGREPWTDAQEKEFQVLRGIEPMLLQFGNDPARRVILEREIGAEKWKLAWTRYEALRFTRLCHFLRAREPDAEIGYSILIYRLTAQDLTTAGVGARN